MYDSLPKNERAFDIDIVGDTTGYHYKGQFLVKCILTINEKHQLALEKTRMQADYANPSVDLAAISTYLAHIRAHTVEAPEWWKNTNEGANILGDENLITHIYDKCLEMEEQWREELKKNAEVAQAANATKEENAKQEG